MLRTKVVLTLFLSVLLLDFWSQAVAAEKGRGACRRADRIAIEDLDMSPDPISEGQRVRAWQARIRLEGKRSCETEIEVREGGEVVGRARNSYLRPGINEVEIEPLERFRFQRGEHCFKVVVDLEGTRREVDAQRRFCARQQPSWSMRERGDPKSFDRRQSNR